MRGCEDEMWRWEDVKMRGCEDERMWRWKDVKMMRRCEDERMWRWDVKMRRCFTDPHYWKNPALRRSREKGERKERRCEGEKMWEKVWRWADVKMSRCEDEQMWEKMWEKMWRWANVKMSRCEDEQMWEKMWEKIWRKMSRWEKMWEKMWEMMWEKIWRWADVKMSRCERRCEDEQMWRWADVKMRRCEDEKVRYRPPLLEEPCAQTLSGIMHCQNILVCFICFQETDVKPQWRTRRWRTQNETLWRECCSPAAPFQKIPKPIYLWTLDCRRFPVISISRVLDFIAGCINGE